MRGLSAHPPALLQGTYYIPTFAVPMLIVSEVILFALLVMRRRPTTA